MPVERHPGCQPAGSGGTTSAPTGGKSRPRAIHAAGDLPDAGLRPGIPAGINPRTISQGFRIHPGRALYAGGLGAGRSGRIRSAADQAGGADPNPDEGNGIAGAVIRRKPADPDCRRDGDRSGGGVSAVAAGGSGRPPPGGDEIVDVDSHRREEPDHRGRGCGAREGGFLHAASRRAGADRGQPGGHHHD
jgi:hypothetical protein